MDKFTLHGCIRLQPTFQMHLDWHIFQAVLENNIEKVKLLLDNGCLLDEADTDGRTAVYIAVGDGHHDILELLLNVGACVNTVAFQHSTPLIKAVDRKDKVAVELILSSSKDCDIDMENYFFQTALTHSIVSKSMDICDMLLKHGASVKCLYKKGLKIEIAKVLCSDIAMTELLLKHTQCLDLQHNLLWGACVLKAYDISELILSYFENPFQLKGLGFITSHEEQQVWERLVKVVTKTYKWATVCSTKNQLLMLLLDFCTSNQNQWQRSNCKQRATLLIRKLVQYGLVIHPQTKLKQCPFECECRKCIFTALYDYDQVTSLKGQCCSTIRQCMTGRTYFSQDSVEQLPVPKSLQRYICMKDW